MSMLALELQNYLTGLLVVTFLVISLMMMLIVLIQKPQGGGLSGAFGGGGAEGAGQTAFGAKTGDVLTTVTIAIFVLFLGTAVGLNYVVQPPKAIEAPAVTAGDSSTTTVPVTPPTPATGTAGTTPAAPSGTPGQTTVQGEHGVITAPEGVKIERVDPKNLPAGLKQIPVPGSNPAPAPAPTNPPAANPPASTPPAATPPATEEPKKPN